MPFSLRRKSSKNDVGKGADSTRPKSRFFDTEESVNSDLAPRNKSAKDKAKRSSRSTFYDDIPPAPQVHIPASFPSDHGNPQPNRPNNLDIKQSDDLSQAIDSTSVWCKRTSILSRSFYDALHDSDLLPYLIQFMTSQNRAHLVKFWLEASNFTSATLSKHETLASQSNNSHKSSVTQVNGPTSRSHTGFSSTQASHLSNQTDRTYEDIKQDAVNIYSRYIALDSSLPIGITDDLRNSSISKICSEDGRLDPLCFRDCQLFVEALLEKEYFRDFLESSYYCKYQIDALTSDRLRLIDILYSDNIIGYFREYVEQENASALLEFWMAVDNFQSQLENQQNSNSSAVTLKEIQGDAMIIYEKYFSLQASNPLGFPDKVRLHVELNICRENGPLPDCFLIPKCIVLETINKTLFSGFMQSQIYYRFLTELIHSASASHGQATPKSKHRRTGSGTSETLSVHSGEASGGALNAGTLSTSSSISDIRGHDDDPRRRQQVSRKMSAMSLGLLDEFGHFTSELEIETIPDLDRKKGSRNTKKKKAEEDMAWQIAKMIISDIGKQVSCNPATPAAAPATMETRRSSMSSKFSLSPTSSLLSSPNVSFRGSKKTNDRKLSQIEQLTADFTLEEDS